MRSRGGIGRAAIGIGISLIALLLVVRTVDIPTAWGYIRGAQPQWLALMVGFLMIDVVMRAVRWKVLLSPVGRVPYRASLGSLLVGYLANNVLPARLGEFVRSHDLGERTRLSKSTILGTIVVERVMDTLVVVVIASLAIFVLSVRGVVASAILVGLAVTALLVVAIVVGLVAHRLPGAERASAFINQWPRIHGLLVRLRTGLAVTANIRVMGVSLALTLISWSCTVLAFAAAAQSVGVEPTMGQAALLAAGVNLMTAVPAGPGYVGTFEIAGVAIAASVGLDQELGLAFVVLVHVFSLLVTSVGGAAALLVGGRRRARDAASVSEPGSQT